MSSIYSAQGLAPKSRLTPETYQQLYQQSIEQNEMFWQQQAEQFLDWFKPWDKVKECNLQQGEVSWFINGQLNVSYNCIDRHLKEHGQDTAFIYEADEPGQAQHISYQMLHDKVCQLANVLIERGVKKGDRVCIYLPMIPEAVYSMLACARIGAVHSVVFAGFSPNALKDRILDSGAKVLITADEGLRAGKTIPLKHNADIALEQCPDVHTCLVVRRTHADLTKQAIDLDYQQACAKQSTRCEPVPMDAEDPLFILYTSGSTGKPKGVLHTTAGYLLGATISHHYVFDYKPGEVYWCTADVGWITGHSYIVYGPLANRATSILFESTPIYPDASRCWQIIDEHQVTTFYTAPTAIRALMAAGQEYLKPYQLDSLRLLGTVGEPINPEAWQWYFNEVGKGRCPIVDTWWQTETGSIMISPIPGAIDLKPGSATQPFFGIEPVLLDEQGEEIDGVGQGNLAFKTCWPSQIRSVYGDHQRLIDTYYSDYPSYYFTGDGAKRDADGNYTITGRVDDVLNVSGHRLGTAEIESAVMQHQAVVEVAAVGFPHEIKGEAIYLFITSNNGELKPDVLGDEITELIVQRIGAIARPDHIQWSKDLPKTRSGKIMRRILRKIAANQIEEIGDTSTLADPSVVQDLIDQRANP